MPATTALIFDMGNVIIPYDPRDTTRILAKLCGRPAEAVHRQVYLSPARRARECGRMTGAAFTDFVNAQLGLRLSPQELETCFCQPVSGAAEMIALVGSLHGKAQLLLLSNTCEWHFNYANQHWGLRLLFEHCVLSYEIGSAKPEPEIYRVALGLAAGASRVFFIDDVLENVRGAEAIGLQGFHYTGIDSLKKWLREQGF